jgi:MraZ protein
VLNSGEWWKKVAGLVFQGASALTLDAKGRLNVPSRHKDALVTACNGELTLCAHPEGYLMVLPRPAWESFRDRLLTLPMEADAWRRMFIGTAVDVDIDSGGRLHVSPELRTEAGLVRDVMLIGTGARLELWDAARHAAHVAVVKVQPMPEAIKNFVF